MPQELYFVVEARDPGACADLVAVVVTSSNSATTGRWSEPAIIGALHDFVCHGPATNTWSMR